VTHAGPNRAREDTEHVVTCDTLSVTSRRCPRMTTPSTTSLNDRRVVRRGDRGEVRDPKEPKPFGVTVATSTRRGRSPERRLQSQLSTEQWMPEASAEPTAVF